MKTKNQEYKHLDKDGNINPKSKKAQKLLSRLGTLAVTLATVSFIAIELTESLTPAYICICLLMAIIHIDGAENRLLSDIWNEMNKYTTNAIFDEMKSRDRQETKVRPIRPTFPNDRNNGNHE